MNKLLKCAKKVLDRYDGDGVISYLQDSDIMEPLRQAVKDTDISKMETTDHIPDVGKMVYTPMTDDEIDDIYLYGKTAYRVDGLHDVERAVIERLGLKWGEQ